MRFRHGDGGTLLEIHGPAALGHKKDPQVPLEGTERGLGVGAGPVLRVYRVQGVGFKGLGFKVQGLGFLERLLEGVPTSVTTRVTTRLPSDFGSWGLKKQTKVKGFRV